MLSPFPCKVVSNITANCVFHKAISTTALPPPPQSHKLFLQCPVNFSPTGPGFPFLRSGWASECCRNDISDSQARSWKGYNFLLPRPLSSLLGTPKLESLPQHLTGTIFLYNFHFPHGERHSTPRQKAEADVTLVGFPSPAAHRPVLLLSAAADSCFRFSVVRQFTVQRSIWL